MSILFLGFNRVCTLKVWVFVSLWLMGFCCICFILDEIYIQKMQVLLLFKLRRFFSHTIYPHPSFPPSTPTCPHLLSPPDPPPLHFPLLRTESTQFIDHREVELMPAWSLHSCIPVSAVKKDTLQATEKPTWPQNLWPTIWPVCKIPGAMMAQILWEWPTTDLTWGLFHKKEPVPDSAWMARSWRVDSPKHDWSKKIVS